MLLSQIVSTLGLAAVVIARAAPVSYDSPLLAVYQGKFETGDVQGAVTFASLAGFVVGYVRMTEIPYEKGPYEYYLTASPVPEGGACDALGGPLNPYDGVPNAPTWAEYMVGDVSGKHGRLKGSSHTTVFIDPYMSLNEENEAFIGGSALQIFGTDPKDVQCVNIQKIFGASPLPKDVKDKAQKLVDDWKSKHPN